LHRIEYVTQHQEREMDNLANMETSSKEMEFIFELFYQKVRQFATAGEFIKYHHQKIREYNKVEKEGTAQLFLSTIHSIKGLEFDHSFLIAINVANLTAPRVSDLEKDGERRMFYVALTRTKGNTYIRTAPNIISRDQNHQNNRSWKPSEFLLELNQPNRMHPQWVNFDDSKKKKSFPKHNQWVEDYILFFMDERKN